MALKVKDNFFTGFVIFILIILISVPSYISGKREREEREQMLSEAYSEGYQEGYRDGYSRAYYAVVDEADATISWASSRAGNAYCELEMIFDEFYLNDELHDRLVDIYIVLEEVSGMELELSDVEYPR